MKNLTKILAVLFCALMMICISACGGENTDSESYAPSSIYETKEDITAPDTNNPDITDLKKSVSENITDAQTEKSTNETSADSDKQINTMPKVSDTSSEKTEEKQKSESDTPDTNEENFSGIVLPDIDI